MRPPLPPAVPLHHLARLLGVAVEAVPDVVVRGVAQDSRRVRPGDVFVAIGGSRVAGDRFVDDARRAGAVAVVGERPCGSLPTLVVPDARAAAGPVADLVHGHPSGALDVVGVTGTNGKTSTVHLLAAVLARAGGVGAISGLGSWGPGFSGRTALTTPEADELQATLARIRDAGASRAVVEVSSHAVLRRRVDGVAWRVAAFTNLSRDHLDAHGDMDAYFETKATLFDPELSRAAVVAVDDEYGRRLAARRADAWTTSTRHPAADVSADRLRVDLTGSRFRLHHPDGAEQVRLHVLGAHQVDNALVAAACALELGVDAAEVAAGLAAVQRVDGRLVPVIEGQPFAAFVDYMHNPAGQDATLGFLAARTPGRLIAVVGATGGRDRGKWHLIGRAAARHGEVVVVTDESPHDDDAAQLRAAVAEGAREVGTAEVVVVPGRPAAFDRAVSIAGPGDTVVVAGRGHDEYLVAGPRRQRFDDEEELRRRCRAEVARHAG